MRKTIKAFMICTVLLIITINTAACAYIPDSHLNTADNNTGAREAYNNELENKRVNLRDAIINKNGAITKSDMESIINNSKQTDICELDPVSYRSLSFNTPVRLTSYLAFYMNSMDTSLYGYNKRMLFTDNMQKLNDDKVAVIYRLETDDSENIYALLVFKCVEREGSIRWESTGEMYFIGDAKSTVDYKNIKPGDNVESLCEIDRSNRYDLMRNEPSIFDVNNESAPVMDTDTSINRMVCKILQDGIVMIEYNNENTITSIVFYDYGDAISSYISIEDSSLVRCFIEEG